MIQSEAKMLESFQFLCVFFSEICRRFTAGHHHHHGENSPLQSHSLWMCLYRCCFLFMSFLRVNLYSRPVGLNHLYCLCDVTYYDFVFQTDSAPLNYKLMRFGLVPRLVVKKNKTMPSSQMLMYKNKQTRHTLRDQKKV